MTPDESEPAPDSEASRRGPRGERAGRGGAAGRPERFLREIVDSIRLGGKLDSDAVLTARLQREGLFDMVAEALEDRALPYSEHFVLALAFQKTVLTGASGRAAGPLVDVFRRMIDEAIDFSAERARFLGFDEIHPGARPTERQERRLVILADFIAALPLEDRRLVMPYLRQHKSAGQIAEEAGLPEGAVRARLARCFKEGHARAIQIELAIAADASRRRQRRPRRKR